VQEDLINKIEYMGALFSSKLVGGTTHLVAKNVLSIKYEVSPSVVLCCNKQTFWIVNCVCCSVSELF
jgi:hypothetical protein